ncbi:MAG: hypothetical protein WCW67_04325 [Candidatus Margulisiibacteriota bacterium]|jgi:hypothetical protein
MDMRLITIGLICLLAISPVLATTAEVAAAVPAPVVASTEAKPANFLTEFDIVFWQTAPFAALWTYVFDRLIFSSQPVHWDAIGILGTVISVGNASIRANKATHDRNWRSY